MTTQTVLIRGALTLLAIWTGGTLAATSGASSHSASSSAAFEALSRQSQLESSARDRGTVETNSDETSSDSTLGVAPFSLRAYLKASTAQAGDELGFSIAISGDTAVVGARFEDSSAVGVNGDQTSDDSPNSGAAYVFVRTGTSWQQQAYLKASNTTAGDLFGYSVDRVTRSS
jgi:hypothetical protein